MQLSTTERLSGNLVIGQSGTTQEVCDAVLREIQESGILATLDVDSLGIYVVSPDAGIYDSVAFWKLALDQGPGFMSPQQFPWTLSNAPGAYIARQLCAHGPNLTLVDDWICPLLPQVRYDLKTGKCRNALVIYINFSDRTNSYFIVFAMSAGGSSR